MFTDHPFPCGFCAASGLEKCITTPSSINADTTSLFYAGSNEQYGRRYNIHLFGVEDFDDEDVYARVVKLANDIGVTISKQNLSMCHCLPSRNPGSRPIIARCGGRETKLCVVTHKRNFEKTHLKKPIIMTMYYYCGQT